MGVAKDSSSDVQIAGIQKFETKDTTLHRRCSARLQKIPDDKKPFYGNDRKRMVDVNNETLGNKKAKAGREKTVGAKGCESNWLLTGTSLFDAKGKSFSARVKETLRTFNLPYLHFVQEEEKRCSTENGRAHENARKRTSKRPDLKAIKLNRFVCQDISNGQEKLCIPATNAIDDPPVSPAGFTYVNHIQVERSINIPPNAPGCNCEGTCSNAKTCSCARLNGSDFPYVLKNGGRLIEAMDVVFECGPNCGYGHDCINRISQRGLKYKLEVYRTYNKGWAVRSWDFIPSGAPVCKYTGVLGKTDESDGISENDYIFEIDYWQTMNGLGGRERQLRDVHPPSDHSDERDNKKLKSVPEFAIDGGSSGNVSRFINHSCEPNLFVQCVLRSHHDVRFARIVLFAAVNIAPMQELTYDYDYMLDSVKGPDGKIKTLPCYCCVAGCRKRLY